MFILGSLESISVNWTYLLGITAEALRANIDWKSAISLQRGQIDKKIQIKGSPPPAALLLRKQGQMTARLSACSGEDATAVAGLKSAVNWTRLTVMTSWCSALESPSRTPLAILVLSSTVSCRWQPMSRPFVAPGTISVAAATLAASSSASRV